MSASISSSPPPASGPASMTSQYLKICHDIGCQPLPDVLTALSTGQRYCAISSSSGALPDGAVIALCAVLPVSHFEMCSFRNLNLNANSWAAIADACSKTRSIQRMVFKECGFRDGGSQPVFPRALAAADLQSLEFVSCPLGDEFVTGLAEGELLGNEKFTTLRLSGCGLSDAGAIRLAKAIEGVGIMCALRTLDLSHNRIGDPGAMGLAGMLNSEASPSSVPLNTLELEGNLITDAGGVALCKAAKAALMLQRLNLSFNAGLTSATMLGAAEAIRFNTGTLREIALAGCRADEASAVMLLRAANKNTTLTLLDIRGVPLSGEGVAHLCALLRYTTTLTTLRADVSSADAAEAIARDLPSNSSLMYLTLGGPVPDGLHASMSEILSANSARRMNNSPAAASPHIHAWIEDSTKAYHQTNSPPHYAGYLHGQSPQQQGRPAQHSHQPQPQPLGAPGGAFHTSVTAQPSSRSRSPSPPPEYARSPRSEAGGSVYSHATHKTGRTHRTHRTATSYLSFGGLTDMSRRTVMVSGTPLRVSASLAAGGAAEKAAIIFRTHDRNDDNFLNRQEMLAALEEMGVLNGIKAKHIGRFLDNEFKKADWDNDGRVSLQDFVSYYEKIAYYQAQMAREGRIKSMVNLNKQMVPQGVERNPYLKRVFVNYAKTAIGQGRVYTEGGQHHMNSAQFHRLCIDAGFMEPDGRLGITAVDVIFTRYRAPGSRRMGFRDFIGALAAVAYEMGFQFDDILEALGCNQSQQPEAFTTRDSVSDMSGVPGVNAVASASLDGSYEMMGVPLATVHEGKEGRKKQAVTKKVTGAKKGVKPSKTAPAPVRGSSGGGTSINNPLYEAQDASAPGHSFFQLPSNGSGRARGASTVGGVSPGRPSVGTAGAVSATQYQPAQQHDLAVLEARVRMEMESRLQLLEGRMEQQLAAAVASAASGTAGGASSSLSGLPASADALMAAKLRQLEGQVGGVVARCEDMDRVAGQLTSLHEILNRLVEEMRRIKDRAEGAAAMAASAAAKADAAASAVASGSISGGGTGTGAEEVEERLNGVTSQLGAVQDGVASVVRDLGAVANNVDTLVAQAANVRQQQQASASQLAALQQQQASLAAQVAALERMPQQGGGSAQGGDGTAPKALEAQVSAFERKVTDRLSRYDGALLQVAKQVDALDQRLREEQDNNLRTIEMLLAAASGSGQGMTGGSTPGPLAAAPLSQGSEILAAMPSGGK